MACNCPATDCPKCGRCYWHGCVCGTFAAGARSSIGWFCPACGKGNTPGVKGCVHCAQAMTSNIDWITGNTSLGRVE